MKHLKKVFAALFFGFIAFAPPGTLIFIAVILLGVFGSAWFVAGLIAALILLAICVYLFRARLSESRFMNGIFRINKSKNETTDGTDKH